MIIRRHYRGCIRGDVTGEQIAESLAEDKAVAENVIAAHKCLTVALYRHEQMLFLYFEALDEQLDPQELFPSLSEKLERWPEKEGLKPWAYMYHIYYHAIPESEEHWSRHGKKVRCGRIAYLFPETIFSYIYWHKAIVDEGLLEGDMYQSIALHENILFSYFEEPKIFTHIKKDIKKESSVINDWFAADPESHFDHNLSGEENFLLIEELFSMGKEDIE